ncbi:uncharacterized protein LOC111114055 [Crassostrea virginica]
MQLPKIIHWCQKQIHVCISKLPIEIERQALCNTHSAPVKYMCVDHEELCCAECLFTQHRKCNQVDGVEKTAEGLLQSDTVDRLGQKLQQYEDCLIQAKTEGEETIKYIDETSDKILEESTELRDKVLKHINNVVETHFTDLVKKVKEEKERLVNFVDTVSDRKLLVASYAQTLKETGKTPLPILVQDYLKIKQQFNDLTKLGLHRSVVELHSDASKELLRILECFQLEEVKMMTVSIPLGGLDFTSARMKMVCELPDSEGDVTGGCYLENGDIVLARHSSKECLYYSNEKLVRKNIIKGSPRDIICMQPSELLISVQLERNIGIFDLVDLKTIKDQFITKHIEGFIYSFAVSSEYVYAACSTFILKLDHEGNTVEKIIVDTSTYSVAVNKQQEIISSSCETHKLSVRSQCGKKMYSYSHEKLRYPYGLDVSFCGNIFVCEQTSNNIHVLTPTAELLKVFEIASPRCIRFKENSYICFVGSKGNKTKIWDFVPT